MQILSLFFTNMKQGKLFCKYFAALLLLQEGRYTLLLGISGEMRKTRNTIVALRGERNRSPIVTTIVIVVIVGWDGYDQLIAHGHCCCSCCSNSELFSSGLSVDLYGCNPMMRSERWEQTEWPVPILANRSVQNIMIIKTDHALLY